MRHLPEFLTLLEVFQNVDFMRSVEYDPIAEALSGAADPP